MSGESELNWTDWGKTPLSVLSQDESDNYIKALGQATQDNVRKAIHKACVARVLKGKTT